MFRVKGSVKNAVSILHRNYAIICTNNKILTVTGDKWSTVTSTRDYYN